MSDNDSNSNSEIDYSSNEEMPDLVENYVTNPTETIPEKSDPEIISLMAHGNFEREIDLDHVLSNISINSAREEKYLYINFESKYGARLYKKGGCIFASKGIDKMNEYFLKIKSELERIYQDELFDIPELKIDCFHSKAFLGRRVDTKFISEKTVYECQSKWGHVIISIEVEPFRKIKILCFSSGKCVIVGTKSQAETSSVWQNFQCEINRILSMSV